MHELSRRLFCHVDPLPLQLNELLIGNVDGVLAIFKGDTSSKAWKKCSGLGTVSDNLCMTSELKKILRYLKFISHAASRL